MCGISGSIINLNSEIEIKRNTAKIFTLIKKNNFKECLKEVKKLRCSYYYLGLGYYKNVKIRYDILNILSQVKKSKNFENAEVIDDILWIINHELLNKIANILNIIKSNNLTSSKQLVLFLCNLISEAENINYLETRGRDSASLSFSLKLSKKSRIKFKFNGNSNPLSINKYSKNKNEYLNITLKTSDHIGYTGENVKNLLNTLYNSNILNKINFAYAEKVIFMTHTRWATVGEVNISNCHPLILKNEKEVDFFSMNGDISNYRSIQKINKKKIQDIDKNCTNDLNILPYVFKEKKLKKLDGSFVIIHQNLKNPENINIYKKGSQGLYVSYDYDKNPIIASDVYGLVNRSDYFNIINDNAKFKLNEIIKKNNIFKFRNFLSSNLSTRDLNKKKYNSYFLKEINDTELFLKRTIFNNIDIKNKKIKNLKIFNKRTIRKLKDNKIRNFIFTGMGSCYTAAVGVSKYLSNSLKNKKIYDIKVEATIASEGSGFYLNEDMSDTVIVVFAQSGTTIDTNVFAKMAKRRGAYTISIVNKKLGDVTYIVDKNLYLGNGRDVELSVPSTKTYTCHLIMGYIMSEQILSIIRKNDKTFVKKLINIYETNFIKNATKRLAETTRDLNFQPINYKNWVVVYDYSFNAFAALELRIKLSECCYKSIPCLSVEQFNQLKLKNCLIFYIGNENNQINLKSNCLINAITNSSFKKKKFNNIIKIKSKEILRNTIETSIALQFLAYNSAIKIDKISKRKNIVKNKKIIKYVFDKYDIEKFKSKKINISKIELSNKLKRPIDTVKHQAKTITVGAIRSDKNAFIIKNKDYKIKFLKSFDKNKFKDFFSNLRENIYLSSDTENEVNKYFLCNIIESCNKQFNKNKKFFFKDFNVQNNLDINSFIHLGKGAEKIESNILLEKAKFYEILKLFLKSNEFTKKK